MKRTMIPNSVMHRSCSSHDGRMYERIHLKICTCSTIRFCGAALGSQIGNLGLQTHDEDSVETAVWLKADN